MQLTSGDIIAQRYRLEEKLGEGGMGEVWQAEHVVTGRKLAVKVLARRASTDATATERFLREARAPAAIGHPGVVDILDAGTDESGAAFIAMELLEGETLAALIARDLVVQPVMLAAVMDPLLTALGTMHTRGFVHRDLKPANVFLCHREDEGLKVKLLDFGIARALDDEGGHTSSGVVLGTPAYMAPEQMRNARNATVRSDLWSVGVMLHEALTGHRPFRGDTFGLLARISGPEQTLSLSQVAPHIPHALCDLVDELLDKDPDGRPTDAIEVRTRLLTTLTECPTIHPVDPPPEPEEPAPAPRSSERNNPRNNSERSVDKGSDSEPASNRSGSDRTGGHRSAGDRSSGDRKRPGRSGETGRPKESARPRPKATDSASPSTEEITPRRPPPMPWMRVLIVGVLFAAVSFAAVMYVTRQPAPKTARAPDAGNRHAVVPAIADAEVNGADAATLPWCANTPLLSSRPELRTLLTRWHDSIVASKGETLLSSFYFDQVHWRKVGSSTLAQVQDGWTSLFGYGGDFRVTDWSKACVSEEELSTRSRHDQCGIANGKGPVILVKLHATETEPGRAVHTGSSVPCDTIDGLYLVRMRSNGRSFRICNETWSLCDGVCASCPQSKACAPCRGTTTGTTNP